MTVGSILTLPLPRGASNNTRNLVRQVCAMNIKYMTTAMVIEGTRRAYRGVIFRNVVTRRELI